MEQSKSPSQWVILLKITKREETQSPKCFLASLWEASSLKIVTTEGSELSVDETLPKDVLCSGCVYLKTEVSIEPPAKQIPLHFNGIAFSDNDECTGHELLEMLLGSRTFVFRNEKGMFISLDSELRIGTVVSLHVMNSSVRSCTNCVGLEERVRYLEGQLLKDIARLEKDQEVTKVGGSEPIDLEAPGLSMKVPTNSTKANTEFSISSPPTEKIIELENVIETKEMRSPVFQLGPHNVDFVVPIELTFKAKPGDGPPALYIQEEGPAEEITALTKVPTNIKEDPIEGTILTMRALRFCIAFVASDVGHIQATPTNNNNNNIQSPDVIKPGLNCRGKCATAGCSYKNKFVTHNVGFKDNWNPLDATEKSLIVCSLCTRKFEPRQIIFCNARYRVQWRLRKSGSVVEDQTYDNEVTGEMLGVIGTPGAAKVSKYFSFIVDCKTPIYNVGVANNQVNTDAAADNAFQGMKILIANFAEAENKSSLFESGPGAALRKKGFTYDIVKSEIEFASRLPNYDIAWVISYYQDVVNEAPFLEAIRVHHNKKKGLFILGDNDPCNRHANAVLPSLFGFSLTGNTPGNKTLTLSYTLEKGTFLPSHIITTGITTLYEGVTVSYPSTIPSNFKVLAHSTDGNPVILYTNETPTTGRVAVDCAWTKLCYNWDSVGTARYVSNVACWLAGFDSNNQYYLI